MAAWRTRSDCEFCENDVTETRVCRAGQAVGLPVPYLKLGKGKVGNNGVRCRSFGG